VIAMPTLDSFRTFVFRPAATVPGWKRSVSALHMPERFSQETRMVSFLAHEHAFRSGSNCVDGDHLVLSLLENPRALTMLESAGANVPALRQAIAARAARQQESVKCDGVLPKSSGVHKAWGDAHAIADSRGARFIEPEHLLLALVVPGNARANTTRILIESGFGTA
jgi:ATP-dependent Clp protease ATP-binding subunit ClpA